MATLVLTTLGTAVGGPLGAALGAALGNRIDHALIGGKGREGPRLTELAVQTSSYGTPIPRLWGTMRVAGTVIWSTDLIEARERTGGGKGRPATTQYSYSASFAVLLSGRPIRGIGRVWADGRLLRGSAGDLKVKAALRVHLGGEDQAPDPLIESAEGAAPAYRGMAYAVWEDLPLGEWGNRIPSMTWEVIADDGAVTVDAIARDMGAAAEGAATLGGFAALGSRRGVFEVLGAAADGWWAVAGDRPVLYGRDGAAHEVVDAGVRVAGGRDGRSRSTAAAERAPAAVTVAHYDPARDHQAGVQRAGTAGGRVERVEMPAAIGAGQAKALAAATLARRQADRVRRTLVLGFEGMALTPGALVTITGEGGRWRVIEARIEGMAVRLALAPVTAASLPRPAASGRVAAAADMTVGRTLLAVAELPALDEAPATAPRLTVTAAGEGRGWRGAALLWSADDGASWTAAGGTAAPGVIGRVEAMPASVFAGMFDQAGAMVVALADPAAVLANADDAGLDRGANLAVAGGELVQWGRAEPLGEGRWRLTRLLRGRRGTEPGAAGAAFALIAADTAATIELPAAAIGREVRIMAAGVGDVEPAEARLTLKGVALRPPAPVKLRLVRDADGATLRWTRRSRVGWRWSDGVDAPLGEEAERYRVTLIGAAPREVEVDMAELRLAPGDTGATVRQRGTWAESPPANLWWGGDR